MSESLTRETQEANSLVVMFDQVCGPDPCPTPVVDEHTAVLMTADRSIERDNGCRREFVAGEFRFPSAAGITTSPSTCLRNMEPATRYSAVGSSSEVVTMTE